jgi:hypothetical protein
MPGGFLISVSLLIFSGILFAVARQRIINNPTMQTAAGCPSCQDYHLVRVHRNRIDRLISSIGIPFARYQCRDCQWNGLRIKQEQRFSSGAREMILIQTTAGPINEQALSGNQSFSTQNNREIASVSPNNKSTNQQSFELQNLLSRKDTNATSSLAELISWEVPLQEHAATEKQKTARVGENVDDSNCGKIISPLGLNLRKDPRSDGEVVVTLEPGTIVELLDSKKLEDGIIWRQIRVDDDKNGWVLDSFLGKCI